MNTTAVTERKAKKSLTLSRSRKKFQASETQKKKKKVSKSIETRADSYVFGSQGW